MWLRDLTVTISFYSWVRPGEVLSKIKTGMQSVSDESLWDSELCKSLEVFEKILMSRWFYESCSQAPWPRDEGSWSWPTVPTFHRQWYQARWYFPPASLSSYFCSNIFIQSQCKSHFKLPGGKHVPSAQDLRWFAVHLTQTYKPEMKYKSLS